MYYRVVGIVCGVPMVAATDIYSRRTADIVLAHERRQHPRRLYALEWRFSGGEEWFELEPAAVSA